MRLSYLSRSARERKVVTPRGTAERRLAVRRRLQLDELERRCLLNAAPAAAIQVRGATLAATEGKPLTAIVAQFSDSDGATKVSGFTATITWGDGAMSPGKVIVDPAHHNQFDILGTHTYAEELSRGQVTVQIHDADGATAQASDPLRVADAALKAAGQTLIDTGQHTFQGTTVATFTDANPKGTITDYFATINWGDGTVTAGQVVKDPKVPGRFDVIGSHKYTNTPIGELVTTTITDIGGSQAGAQSKIIVQFTLQVHSLSVAATEGKSLTTPVAKFSDTNIGAKASDFTATIDWGDGSPKSQGKVIVDSASPNQFDVQGTHTYAEELPRGRVTVTIHGTDGTSGFTSDPVQVADAALKATGTTLVDESLGRLQSVTVATFTDADPNGTITDYRATIAWGDGAVTTGQVVKDPEVPGQFAVIGSHNYIADPFRVIIVGNETITTTIKDIGGSQAVVQSQVLVAQPTKIGTKEGAPIVTPLTVAAFASNTTLNLAQYHATVDWGDGTTSVGTIKADTKIAHQYDITVASRRPFEEEGNYLLVTTVTGPKGLNITIPGVVTVQDAPLTANGAAPTLQATPGTPLTGVTVASFTDQDPNGTASDYTTTIDWGDNTTSPGTIQAIPGNGNGNPPSFNVLGDHTYAKPGIFQVKVTVTDAGGATLTLTPTVNVNVPTSTTLQVLNAGGTDVTGTTITSATTVSALATIGGVLPGVPLASTDKVQYSLYDVTGTVIQSWTEPVGTPTPVGTLAPGYYSFSATFFPITQQDTDPNYQQSWTTTGNAFKVAAADGSVPTTSQGSADWTNQNTTPASIIFTSVPTTSLVEGQVNSTILIDRFLIASNSITPNSLTATVSIHYGYQGWLDTVGPGTVGTPPAITPNRTVYMAPDGGVSGLYEVYLNNYRFYDNTNSGGDISVTIKIYSGSTLIGTDYRTLSVASDGQVDNVQDIPSTEPINTSVPLIVGTFADWAGQSLIKLYTGTVTFNDPAHTVVKLKAGNFFMINDGSMGNLNPSNDVEPVVGIQVPGAAYPLSGPQTINITVNTTGASADFTSTINVSGDNAMFTTNSLTFAAEGNDFYGTLPVGYIGPTGGGVVHIPPLVQINNPAVPAGNFLAVVDWGDHTDTTNGVHFNSLYQINTSGVYQEELAHAYKVCGTYTATFTIVDTTNGTSFNGVPGSPLRVVPITLTITEDTSGPTNGPISAATTLATDIQNFFASDPPLGTPFLGSVATFTDANPFGIDSQYSIKINWGDGTVDDNSDPDGLTYVMAGPAYTPGTVPVTNWVVYGAHTYETPSTTTPFVTITDKSGGDPVIAYF